MNCIIASVGYRLAPEFPFPTPLEDCYTATKGLAKGAEKLMVIGESAGGNLAAAVACMASDKKEFKLHAQILIYPAITSDLAHQNYENCPDQFFLTQESMEYFWKSYISNKDDLKNPYASLDLRKDFHGLPPACIITGEYDPLASEAHQYAIRLKSAGVPVIEKMLPKLIHGFLYIFLYNEKEKVQWTEEILQCLVKIGFL